MKKVATLAIDAATALVAPQVAQAIDSMNEDDTDQVASIVENGPPTRLTG